MTQDEINRLANALNVLRALGHDSAADVVEGLVREVQHYQQEIEAVAKAFEREQRASADRLIHKRWWQFWIPTTDNLYHCGVSLAYGNAAVDLRTRLPKGDKL